METQTPELGLEVIETLKYIIDPEIGIDIVDLGLVYEVSQLDEKLLVRLSLTTPDCPMSNTITTAVEQILLNRFHDYTVNVELVWTPAWSTDMISEEGMRKLNGK